MRKNYSMIKASRNYILPLLLLGAKLVLQPASSTLVIVFAKIMRSNLDKGGEEKKKVQRHTCFSRV